jgi:hypothetical protein
MNESYFINESLFMADKYFILNIREQYSKGFDIKGSYDSSEIVESPTVVNDVTYVDMVNIYNEVGSIDDFSHKYDYYTLIMNCIKLYGKTWLDYSYAKKMVDEYNNEYARIIITLRDKFKVGKRYSVKEVKNILQAVYTEYGLTRKANSTDLQEFMQVRELKSNGNRFVEIVNKYKTIK